MSRGDQVKAWNVVSHGSCYDLDVGQGRDTGFVTTDRSLAENLCRTYNKLVCRYDEQDYSNGGTPAVRQDNLGKESRVADRKP